MIIGLLALFGVIFCIAAAILVSAVSSTKAAVDFFVTGLVIVAISSFVLAVAGCGPKSSTHTVQGEATIKVVVGVDVTVCDQFPEGQQRLECVQSLLDLAKVAAESNNQESTGGFVGI